MSKLIYVMTVGLIPLWVCIAILIYGSYRSHSPDYWNAAPWLLFVALPFCVISLAQSSVAFDAKKARNKEAE